jgi:hypothetical protein
MAMVQLDARTCSTVKIPRSRQDNPFSVRYRPIQILVLVQHRFWWHTKAYGTVLSIMLLTLASLIYLYMHWSCRKLLSILK